MDDHSRPKTVYHYCSMQSFYSIFKTKTFWINDIFKMNDYKEMIIFLDDIEQIVIEEFNKEPFGLLATSRITDKQFDFNEDEVINIIIKLFKKWKNDLIKNDSLEYKMFIACFSEEKDILSQWCMYADNANGVSIGFNVSSITGLIEENPNFQFIKVKYISTDEKRNIQEDLIKNYLKDFRENLAENLVNSLDAPEKMKKAGLNIYFCEEDILEMIESGLYERCFLNLLRESIAYKNAAFAQESEWRLVYIPTNTYWNRPPDTEQEEVEYGLMRYRLANNLLVKYISLPLDKLISNPETTFYESGIVEGDMTPNIVVLGPKNQNGTKEIIDFLTTEGFSYFADKSIISYR